MKTIDGAQGEGGGQILRTALSLSAVTGQPFTLRNIRAKRPKPGLMRQHLTCVQAAAAVCGADVSGAELGSQELVFRPGAPKAGSYTFAIGTAGSVTLVAQTVLPILASVGGESHVTITGGTHNENAPGADFVLQAWLPLVRQMGYEVEVEFPRLGFYPAGGGEMRVHIAGGASLKAFSLRERGAATVRSVTIYCSAMPEGVARKQQPLFAKALAMEPDAVHVVDVDSPTGPGNAVCARYGFEQVSEVFTVCGARGRASEVMTKELTRELRAYQSSDAPVGIHLADQLMLPLALGAGGVYRSLPLTRHSRTNLWLINDFLGPVIEAHNYEDKTTLIEVKALHR